MTGVAVEQMLELWCVELRQVKSSPQVAVCSSECRGLGGCLPRWAAWAGAAQDRLDAG